MAKKIGSFPYFFTLILMMMEMLMIMMLFKLMTELLHSIHECVAFFFIFPLALCRNKCASGCPENTTCEWGLCQCEDPEMVQIWGECVLPDDENLLHRNGTLSEEEIVGVSCLNDSDCQAM